MSLRAQASWEDIRRPLAFASPETGLTSTDTFAAGE
jgi:hypothetical protein